ncbi:hypothetical protein FBU59_005448 [Linderina macrospora]|uniref:Uncharacterized protein n=1 Tax=Linderina macrospora TaxID=4868 RepID=A0ACC1J2X3_9FUNG|nr:hypothetical protein FBU59_005448 [Linderina macrospora]
MPRFSADPASSGKIAWANVYCITAWVEVRDAAMTLAAIECSAATSRHVTSKPSLVVSTTNSWSTSLGESANGSRRASESGSIPEPWYAMDSRKISWRRVNLYMVPEDIIVATSGE